MNERMIVVTVPFGCHVLLPEHHITTVLNMQFVNCENYPKRIVAMNDNQRLSIETVEKSDVQEYAPPEPAPSAYPAPREEVQAMTEPAITNDDIPF